MRQKRFSLKTRIFAFSFAILALMLFSYIFVSSRFFLRSMNEKLDADYGDVLTLTSDTMEQLLWTLTLTSQQLLENPDVRASIVGYQNAADLYERQEYYAVLLETISSLTMSNTNIALLYFYDTAAGDFIYASLPADYGAPAPVLYQNSEFRFCGPAESASTVLRNTVLSVSRTEEIAAGRPVLLRIESGYYSFDAPQQSAAKRNAYLAVTNYQDELIFSTLPQEHSGAPLSALRAYAAQASAQTGGGEAQGYHFFHKTSSQGWTAYVIVPASVYTQDWWRLLRGFVLCSALIALLGGLFALYFWRSIYHPLQILDRQLGLVLSDAPAAGMRSAIPEYDHLLRKIGALQSQIQTMMRESLAQERRSSQMQLEKLRAQINPHFLMNTLNTLHWLALMNKQPEIDRLTQALSHLLSYNLDKDSRNATLRTELAAAREYVTLQQVRYDFSFVVKETPADALSYPCPKFLLQPFLENSLKHGYREHMTIALTIAAQADAVTLRIADDGTGMDEAALQKVRALFAPQEASTENAADGSQGYPAESGTGGTQSARAENAADGSQGIPAENAADNAPPSPHSAGIGLSYVAQSLREMYGTACTVTVSGAPGEGCVFVLRIPKLGGGGYHA